MSYYDRIKNEVKSEGGEAEAADPQQETKRELDSSTESKIKEKESAMDDGQDSGTLGNGYLPDMDTDRGDKASEKESEPQTKTKNDDGKMELQDGRRAKKEDDGTQTKNDKNSGKKAQAAPKNSPFSELIERSQTSYGDEEQESNDSPSQQESEEEQDGIEVLSSQVDNSSSQETEPDKEKQETIKREVEDKEAEENQEPEVDGDQLVSTLQRLTETNRQILETLEEINDKL